MSAPSEHLRHQALPTPAQASAAPIAQRQARRNAWLKTLYQWHWISAALALAGMLLFALTGITLNHSGAIEASPRIESHHAALPAGLVASLRERAGAADAPAAGPLPAPVANWVAASFAVSVANREAEWSADEIYLALPRPGGDAWLRLDLESATAEYELTDRGWIAWLNDLHKGRHAGIVWSGFIDLFALACVLFSLTGLLILQRHAANRAAVWPVVGLGIVLPTVLVLLFVH